jgi:hypothetical protein
LPDMDRLHDRTEECGVGAAGLRACQARRRTVTGLDGFQTGSARPRACWMRREAMRLLCSDHLGAPLAMMKVHPSRSRLVGFSASRDEAFLWGWGAGRLRQLARLGTPRDYGSTRRIRVLGHEVELAGSGLARDVGSHPDGVHMATVGEGRPIEVYRVFDGEPIRTIADTPGPVNVMMPSGSGWIPWEFPPEHQGFDRIAFSDSGRFIIAGPIAGLSARV